MTSATSIVTPGKDIDYTGDRFERGYARFGYRVPAECVDKYMKPYSIVKYIACGAYGCTFQLCKGSDCLYVIKITTPGVGRPMAKIEGIENEIKITKLMGELGVAPAFIDSWVCDGEYKSVRTEGAWLKNPLYFIVLQKMEMNLENYIENYNANYLAQNDRIIQWIQKLLKTMNNAGYIHGDLYPGNVMVNLDQNNNVEDLKLIDFGLSKTVESVVDKELNEIPERFWRVDGRYEE